ILISTLVIRAAPISILFPYTTLFRSIPEAKGEKTITEQINSEIRKTITTALHIGDPDDVPSISIEESIKRFNEEYQGFKRDFPRSEEHTSELQSRENLVCRLLLEKKN